MAQNSEAKQMIDTGTTSTSSTRRDAALLLAAGFAVGFASSALLLAGRRRRRRRDETDQKDSGDNDATSPSSSSSCSCPPPHDLPPFAQKLMIESASYASLSSGENDPTSSADNNDDQQQQPQQHHWHRIRLREWEDPHWRSTNGWLGRDYCHNAQSNAVRVLDYYHDGVTHDMVGIVYFGPDAESHRGLCHGGAMSALMDDFCGHVAFVTSDGPWSGATVQVNVSLKKPVRVGSVLRILGRVTKREGRKVYTEAVLDDGGGGGSGRKDDNDGDGGTDPPPPVVYAKFEGLSIDGVKMFDEEDDIAKRTWEVNRCRTSGRFHRQDSGWNI